MLELDNFNQTISEIVRNDYRTAEVFKKHGINYCCGGKITLQEACSLKNIDLQDLQKEIKNATKRLVISNDLRFDQWKIDFLIDYIINVHHAYLFQVLPSIQLGLSSFALSHQKQYPELVHVQEIVNSLHLLLLPQCRHEEDIIFPYIKQLETTYRRKEPYGNLFVRTLRKPLKNMEIESKKVGELLEELRKATHNYQFPDNACTNHQVNFNRLKELDDDITQHKHLENNILFPKALAMEHELLYANL